MIQFKKSAPLGFTLVELAIVLAIIGVLTVGLWRLISASNQQVQYAAAGAGAQAIANGVQAFLASANGQTFLTKNPDANCSGADDGTGNKLCGPNSNFILPLPAPQTAAAGTTDPTTGCVASYGKSTAAHICDFLPAGTWAGTTNPYGANYIVRVRRDGTPNTTAAPQPPATYSFMVLATGGNPVPDNSGGAISALIGGNGGFVYTGNVCTKASPDKTACGALSSWSELMSDFGFGGSYSGSIVVRVFVSPQQDSTYPWLARQPIDPIFSFNTMNTTLYAPLAINMATFGAGAGGSNLNMVGGTINMGASGAATGGGTVNVAAGTVDMQGGTLNFDGGVLSNTGGPVSIDKTGIVFNVSDGGVGLLINSAGSTSGSNTLLSLNEYCSSNSQSSIYTPGSCPVALYVGGDMQILGKIFGTSNLTMSFSDIRLKKNIEILKDPLGDLMRLNAVSYTFKNGTTKNLGVIAQDVEKVYPELVGERDGYKAVSYEGLIAPLIGAVQELKKENDQLKARVDGLQKRMDQKQAN